MCEYNDYEIYDVHKDAGISTKIGNYDLSLKGYYKI